MKTEEAIKAVIKEDGLDSAIAWIAGVIDEKYNRIFELEEYIKKLEYNAKSDTKWLAAYHKWCEMNGCAPSSSDLIAASNELKEKKDVSL